MNMEPFVVKTPGNEVFLFETNATRLSKEPYMLDRFNLVLSHSGWTKGSINLQPYYLRPHSFAVNLPGQILQHSEASSDYRCTIVSFASNYVRNFGLPYNFEFAKYVNENPIGNLSHNEYNAAMNFIAMIKSVLTSNRLYALDIVKHLSCAFVYSFLQNMALKHRGAMTADETLFHRFIELVKKDYRTVRTAKEYASKLCVSVGYLSKIVKRQSNKTILDWVGDYVILEAKAMLHSSNMTVQQISNHLNFPNQSFFGKYFKARTGISPSQYRMTISNQYPSE